MIVVDFSMTKPSVAQLKAWGAVAVGMYVSRDPAKNATPKLVDEYAQAGIKTFLFFEDTARGPLKGYAQGKADAELALAEAAKLGQPDWAPIIAGVDFDIPDFAPGTHDPAAKLGPVAQYFKAWNEVLGVGRTGGYGGYWAVSRLCAAHLASCAVQTIAWSGGKVDTRDILALQNGQMLDSGNVDVELIEDPNKLNRVAWVPGEPQPGAHPVQEHPVDAPWLAKGQLSLSALAHGPMASNVPAVLATTLRHAGFDAHLSEYLDCGDLKTAHLPAGTVVWYPKQVPA